MLILTTAVRVFAEHGPDAPMEEIAQAAGLGVGTLYRHFPDRRALLEEVAAGTLRDILAAERTAGGPGGWDVLLYVIGHCATLPMSVAKSLVGTPLEHPELPGLVDEVDAMFARLAERAQEEGAMRTDLTPSEAVRVLSAVVCRAGPPDAALTTVILDGLRARRPVG